MEEPPFVVTNDSPTRLTPELSDLVPTNPNQPYNIKEMIEAVSYTHLDVYKRQVFQRTINSSSTLAPCINPPIKVPRKSSTPAWVNHEIV